MGAIVGAADGSFGQLLGASVEYDSLGVSVAYSSLGVSVA